MSVFKKELLRFEADPSHPRAKPTAKVQAAHLTFRNDETMA
jgi:hypothetical protein